MPANMIRLGPFLGGYNSFSDPTAIADNEVSELVNLELDLDGSLRNRPPIVKVGGAPGVPIPGGTGIDILGWYKGSGGVKYLIATNRNNNTYYFDGTTWVSIAAFRAAAMAQARDKLWLIAPFGSASTGGSWTPSGGFVADANMPKGGTAIAFKDRVWIGLGKTATSNGARLYLSTITSGTVTWPVTPVFINIGSGDGENIVDLAVYFESLIIFKEGSTFSFSFGSDPALGEVRRQSENVGAIDKGCVTGFQNQLYVVFDDKVYEFSNYNYTELNKKVPLRANNPSVSILERTSISYWSDRLFVQFYDVTYVYQIQTGSWAVWDSALVEFMGRVWLIPGEQDDQPKAYTYAPTATDSNLYEIVDAIGSNAEAMVCSVATKNYDYQNPSNFKALKNWGVDCISKIQIEAWARPIVYNNIEVTWDLLKNGNVEFPGNGGTRYDMTIVGAVGGEPGVLYVTQPNGVIERWAPTVQAGGYTWDYLKDTLMATWDRIFEPDVEVQEQVDTAGTGSGRKYIKFPQALRFRQIGFRLAAETNGDTSTAPLHIFSLMTKVADKQYVSRRIS